MNILTLIRNNNVETTRRVVLAPRPTQSAICDLRSAIRGFTLLEILIAVVILGFAFAVILASVNRNLILASDSKSLAVAEEIVQREIAKIELEGFPDPVEQEVECQELPECKLILSITPRSIGAPGLGQGAGIELRIVRLLVTWNDGGKELEVTLAMSDLR